MRARPALVALLAVTAIGWPAPAAAAPKVDKVPVAFGSWTGPHSGSFKSALRNGLAKDCAVVQAKSARAIIDGEVRAEGKGVVVRVIVKSAKSGEVAEQRDFPFSKPTASDALGKRMGRAIAEIVRRTPD